LNKYEYWEGVFGNVGIYIVFFAFMDCRTIFNALKDYLKLKPRYSDKPIDSFIQVIMIVLLVGWDHRDYFPPFEINQTEILTTFGAVSAL
jgi:miniconductance mechanosensitive channel